MVNGQFQISSERTVPVTAIKYVSTSNLKDDWFSLGVSSPQEADPLISCVLKTEFFAQLDRVLVGGVIPKPGERSLIQLRVGSSYVNLADQIFTC